MIQLVPASSLETQEEGGGKAGQARTLLPEACYEAQATGYKVVLYHGTERIFLRFQITQFGEHQGEIVWGVFQKYPQYRPRMSFYKAWTIAKGSKPKRGERMIPEDLCSHIFLIRAITVNKDEDGDLYPKDLWYSKAKIIKLIQRNCHPQPTSDNPSPKTNYRLPTLPSLNKSKKRGGPN